MFTILFRERWKKAFWHVYFPPTRKPIRLTYITIVNINRLNFKLYIIIEGTIVVYVRINPLYYSTDNITDVKWWVELATGQSSERE